MVDKKYAPYPPAGNLIHAIRNIREKGYAGKLTIEALESMGIPTGNTYRVQAAMKWLKLYNDDLVATELMAGIRKAATEKYPVLIEGMVRESYAEVFQFANPATDSIDRVTDAFRSFTPAAQRNRMVVCFLALCAEAGIALADSPVTEAKVPKSGKSQGLKKKTKSTPPPPAPPRIEQQYGGVLFHPVIDAVLREAKKLIDNGDWSEDARKGLVQSFTTNLDLFLPVKK
jgi:hypothetical protein